MSLQRSDTYFYGCWIDDLPQQLLWAGKAERPTELELRPNWSWSSTACSERIFLVDSEHKAQTNLCGPFKMCLPKGLQVRCFVDTQTRLVKVSDETDSKITSQYFVKHISYDELVSELTWLAELNSEMGTALLLSMDVAEDNLFVVVNDIHKTVGIAVVDDMHWLSQKVNMNTSLASTFLVSRGFAMEEHSNYIFPDKSCIYYGLLVIAHDDEPNSYHRAGVVVIYSQAYFEQAIEQDIILL